MSNEMVTSSDHLMNHAIQFDIIMDVIGLMRWRQMRINVPGGRHDNAFGYVMSHYASPQESFYRWSRSGLSCTDI